MGSLRREGKFTIPPPPRPLLTSNLPPVFVMDDKDHNGKLEGAELGVIASSLSERFGVADEKYRDLFQAADKDGDGTLRAPEVKQLISAMMREGNWTPKVFSESD